MTADAGTDFESDVQAARLDLEAARQGLLQSLSRVSEGDLDHSRRGGWTIAKVLRHVVDSERLYVAGLAHLQGQSPPETAVDEPGSPPAWTEALGRTRADLLGLLDEASVETFYELRPLGHEEYSVLSLLENVALHDREHAAQIDQIMAES